VSPIVYLLVSKHKISVFDIFYGIKLSTTWAAHPRKPISSLILKLFSHRHIPFEGEQKYESLFFLKLFSCCKYPFFPHYGRKVRNSASKSCFSVSEVSYYAIYTSYSESAWKTELKEVHINPFQVLGFFFRIFTWKLAKFLPKWRSTQLFQTNIIQ